MRPAAGARMQDEQIVVADHEAVEAVVAEEKPATVREEPEVMADRPEPAIVARVDDGKSLIDEPKTPVTETELPSIYASGRMTPPVRVDDTVEPEAKPARREPLPEMRVESETFRDAWERHRREEEAAAWREFAVAESTHEQEDDEEEPIMRNPFARRKPAPTPEPVRSGLGEIGIESAAERLIAGGATRAIFVSPEGDEAAAAAVMVAREVADAGLRVLLIDLTASGAASRPMLDSVSYPGITNLLASEAQFTDAIHTDHYSDCDVMPVGTANPARAMRAADRLPIIMESLTTAYDVVVVECGPADAEGIRRLVADGTEIIVSVLEPDDEIAAAAEALKAGGYRRMMLVTPADYQSPNAPMPGRSAA